MENINYESKVAFILKIMLVVYQVSGIFFLGIAVAYCQGVIDESGREILFGTYLEYLVPFLVAIPFGLSWFTIHSLDTIQGQKTKNKFLVVLAALVLQVVFIIVYIQIGDRPSLELELLISSMYFWASGFFLRLGIINAVSLNQKIRSAFAKK